MNKDKELKFTLDEYGRIILEDLQLLEMISGASLEQSMLEADGGCGNNSSCSNQSC